nr:group-specific protein [Terribacillus halophilus]
MIFLFEIKVNEEELKELYLKILREHIEKIEQETTFWDSKDLRKNVRLSWNTIQDQFFFDERFPKIRVGKKWLFHAAKTREFLDEWFEEQRMSKK